MGAAIGRSVARLSGTFSGAKFADRSLEPTVPFTMLPPEVFDKAAWVPLSWGRWQWEDHVTLGESRVIVRLVQLMLAVPACHRSKAICLEDNQPTAGAMNKGRSTSAPLNYLCRRRAASCLAGGFAVLLPWVESARMPADELSRCLTF